MKHVRGLLLLVFVSLVASPDALSQIAGPCDATVTSSDTVPLMTTGWSSHVRLDKFDPDLGTLTGLVITLTGTIQGQAQYESLNNKGSNITLSFSSNISVFRPGGASLITNAVPHQQFMELAPPYDGITDFGGSSGNTFPGIIAVAMSSHSSPMPISDLSLFTGVAGTGFAGTITLPVVANGTSTGSGAGIILQFMQQATATVEVRYTYNAGCNSLCNGDGGDQLGCTNCPCMNNASAGTIGGCVNSALNSARLVATGSDSVSLPPGSLSDLRFSLSGAPPAAFCVLCSGDAVEPLSLSNPCVGSASGTQAMAFDGLRCAATNIRRHGGRSADANGHVGLTTNPWGGEANPTAGIAHAGGSFVAGQTRYFQVVNRDDVTLGCMRGLNTSQAISVTFTP